MTAVFPSIDAVPALLLLAVTLLTASARAAPATAEPCRQSSSWVSVRQYPIDNHVTHLWMNNCGLTELNAADFKYLANLKFIYLYSNNLTTVDTAIFRTSPSLKTLRLDSNKIRELPVFRELSCHSLTWLELHHNELTAVSDARTFSACGKLENLYLSYNQIGFLHPEVFKSLTELTHLHLHHNKIKFIPSGMFATNVKLEFLSLTHNKITNLPADFATGLKRVGGIKYFFFEENPWHCACLLELLADAKKSDVWSYGSYTYYGDSRPSCVFISFQKYKCSDFRLISSAFNNFSPVSEEDSS